MVCRSPRAITQKEERRRRKKKRRMIHHTLWSRLLHMTEDLSPPIRQGIAIPGTRSTTDAWHKKGRRAKAVPSSRKLTGPFALGTGSTSKTFDTPIRTVIDVLGIDKLIERLEMQAPFLHKKVVFASSSIKKQNLRHTTMYLK